MFTTKLKSASVRFHTLNESIFGVMEVYFSGLIGESMLEELSLIQRRHTQYAPAVVVRLDRAVLLFDKLPNTKSPNIQPAAVIVRHDQYAAYSDYVNAQLRFGVLRGLFLDTHSEMAYEWAECQARLRRSGSEPSPSPLPVCDPVYL